MDVQYGALARAVLDEDVVTLVSERITGDFFPDEKYQRIFKYLIEHWNKHGVSPNLAVAQGGFPSQRWDDPGQTLRYFIDELRRRRKTVLLMDTLNDAAGVLQDTDDPDATDTVIGILQGALHQVRHETTSMRDEDVTNQAAAYDRLLTLRMENPGHLRGLSTGFDGIDMVTGGLQNEQLVTIVGTPKTGKSSALLYMALAVHRAAAVPLFVSFEMSFQEQMDRLASLLSGVGLTKIMNGALTQAEKKKVVRTLAIREAMKPFIISTDVMSATTVSGIQMKIQQYQPDAVFIDGTYLMDPETPSYDKGSPQALTEITRNLKRLAQTQSVPIVNTTQALLSRAKKGLSLYSIGYSSSFAQDSDIVLGTERPDDEKIARFHVIASRSGPRAETWISWDWDYGSVLEMKNHAQQQQGGDAPASAYKGGLDDD